MMPACKLLLVGSWMRARENQPDVVFMTRILGVGSIGRRQIAHGVAGAAGESLGHITVI